MEKNNEYVQSVTRLFIAKLFTNYAEHGKYSDARRKRIALSIIIDYSSEAFFNILQREQLKKELVEIEPLFLKNKEKIPFNIFKNATVFDMTQESYYYLKITRPK